MKRIFTLVAAFAAVLFSLGSCSLQGDNYPAYFYNALVTVKHTDNGQLYLQLDDNTTLQPENLTQSPFGDKQVRALVNYVECDKKPDAQFDKLVKIHRMDEVLTKALAESAGEKADNDKEYGTAPIEIINSWVTIVEDGYLTLAFCGYWGDVFKVHRINLVSGVDSADPYLLELRHDACDDNIIFNSIRMNGIAAFDLSSLPDTKGEKVQLKIRYISFTGEKTVNFDYCTGASTLSNSAAPEIIGSAMPGVK